MDYLQPLDHYLDLYDLLTIKTCRRIVDFYQQALDEASSSEKSKNLSQREIEKTFNYMLNMKLFELKASEYKRKQAKIDEWMEKDRIRQNYYDYTPAPIVRCPKCNKLLKLDCKSLHDIDEKHLKMQFFFACKKCDYRGWFTEEGESIPRTIPKCSKCGKEATNSHERQGNVITSTTTCNTCGFQEVDVDDFDKWDEESRKEKEADRALLEKYRDQYCFSKEDGEKAVAFIEQAEYAHKVYEFEKAKYDDPVYNELTKVKKISFAELESRIKPLLKKEQYSKLVFDNPKLERQVIVKFTIQDANFKRSEKESISTLKKILNQDLANTNWRLSSSGIRYRLGFLSGDLRGYESQEDLLKLVGKVEKPQEPDTYSYHRVDGYIDVIGLAKLCGEMEGKENQRKKRLEQEPEGFILEENGEDFYSCNLCKRSHRGNEIWWNLYGQVCLECHKNLKDGVVPTEIVKDDDLWFSDSDFKYRFDIHPTTGRKMIRDGLLKGRSLKDSQGYTYFTVFLTSENAEFIKEHPQVGDYKKEYYYLDEKGDKVWL